MADGDFLTALNVLERMLSECASFQALCGVESAEAALPYIFWTGEKPYTENPKIIGRAEKVFPDGWAYILMGQGAGLDLSVSEGGGCYLPVVPLVFWIDRATPEAEVDDPKLESKNFLKLVGNIMTEFAVLSNTEGNLLIDGLTIEAIGKNDKKEVQPHMEVMISISRRGGR